MRGFSVVGLLNTKIETNVGGALRAAHCYGATMVILEGRRYRQQASDTTKAPRHIPLVETLDIFSVIPHNCIPIAVEVMPECKALPTFKHPERAIYIFGPEDGNIPHRVLSRCKDIVYVPTKFCMNLAATINVVLYDRYLKETFNVSVCEKSGLNSQQ